MHEASEETHHKEHLVQQCRDAEWLLPSSGELHRFPCKVYVGTASSSGDSKKEEEDSWTVVWEAAESFLLALA